MQRKEKVIYMNRNRKLIASLVGIVALTNTVMPVCAAPKQPTLEYGEDFEFHLNDTENVNEQGNINLLDPSVGLVSNSNNMNNNGVFYQIQPNDTLSSIAKRNNTTVEKLMATAGITNPNKIKAGDILVSPHITEEFVLSKGQDPKQNKKQYMTIGVVNRELTQSERNILSSLFNAEEYAKMYPDVVEACKGSLDLLTFEQKLFYHFINIGIWEGRQPSESFSVAAYASAYSDLKKAFGSHIVDYYKHYYNTTVIGNENRTITTVQKAQDAGIKVTDFSGNTVAVDEAGNIVTGEKADKIAAEKNLGTPIGSVITTIPNVTVSADFNEETEKEEETKAPSSEEKEESSAPVAPTKTFAEAYNEWLASKPVGGSANVMESWKKREPNLADYADGRAFLAKKEAWEKEMPDYDAYLATTAYASDYEAWLAEEPKLANYTILIGNQTAEKKYNEDYEAWQELAPKPEDYIQYTSFEADYNAWLAAAPVPVEGKYETAEKAMEAYTEAHTEWEANKPKQSDYFDEEGYNKAVTEWTNKTPKKENYHNYEGYVDAVAKYERENPKPARSDYFNEKLYQAALTEHAAEEPQFTNYFLQEDYTAAQTAYTDYCNQLAAYEAYETAKNEYDAAKSKWESDTAAYEEYLTKNAIYTEYEAWQNATAEEYFDKDIITIYTGEQGCVYYQYKFNDRGDLYQSTDLEEVFRCAQADIGGARDYYNNPPIEPTEVQNPGDFTQVEPTEVSKPDEKEDPEKNQINYLTGLAKEGNATDKASAESLFNTAHSQWVESTPSSDDDEFYEGYAEALAEWEASYPEETDYYNIEKYDSLDAAKAAYEKAVADHEAAKPSEQDYVKESAGDATDKESALKAFEEDTASYEAENPEPTESEYTSNVMTEEEKAEYDKAVEDYNAAEPSVTDDKYVGEAKETKEYKETVVKHEADKPDQSTYVDDMYPTEDDAVCAFIEDHSDWETAEPSEDIYIADTTYADDIATWEESAPDFNEYFGIEAQG